MIYIPTGVQAIVDMYDCEDMSSVYGKFLKGLRQTRFRVVYSHCHDFGSGEVTALAILSQSHAALHTWSDHRYLSIDIFSCGSAEKIRPQIEQCVLALRRIYKARSYDVRIFERGAGLSNYQPAPTNKGGG